MSDHAQDEIAIRELVENWANAVSRKDLTAILLNHSANILMFDVPPPLASKGIEAYRKTWDLFFSWARDPVVFDISEIEITPGDDVAFVTALMRCAGTERHGQAIELTSASRSACARLTINGLWYTNITRFRLLNDPFGDRLL